MYRFTKHCLERMKSREIKLNDIARVIRLGVKRSVTVNNRVQYDYSDLRLIATPDNRLITVFRLGNRYLFPKKDTREFRHLYHRRLASLWERELLAEMRIAI